MKLGPQLDLCRAYLNAAASLKGGNGRHLREDGPVVTISRAAGARGKSIAAVLVKQLENDDSIPKRRPWTLFDQDLLQHVIEEHKLPERTADYFPEDRKPDEIHTIIGEILGLHSGVYTTLRKTAETIRRLAKAGNSVIVGRGGNFITADIRQAVHVRLVGSEEYRIRHFAKVAELSHPQAAAEVRRLDRARKTYIQKNFKHDIDNPLLYDMVLNTDRLTDEQAAELIAAMLRQKAG